MGLGEMSSISGYYFMDKADAKEYIENKLISDILTYISDIDGAKEIVSIVDREEGSTSTAEELYCTIKASGKQSYQVMIYIYKLELYQR